MIALGIQLAFATVASFRGWGFLPWGLILAVMAAAFIFSQGFVYAFGAGFTVGLFLTADWALVVFLGFLAFTRKEDV